MLLRQKFIYGLHVFVFFSLCPIPVFAQEHLDLPQAINYALSQNKELVRTAFSIDSGQLHEADATTEFQPNISPDVMLSSSEDQTLLQYGPRISKKLSWGTTLSMGAGVVTDLTRGADYGAVRFEIEQPIFRYFGTAINLEAVRLSSSGLKAARRKYESQKADLVLEVVKSYETLLRLKQQVRADQDSLKRNDALHRVTKAKEGFGKTNRVDTLRVELLVGQARLRLEADQEQLASSQRDFAELLAFPPDTEFELQSTPLIELQIPDPEAAVKIALKNRLDYAQVLNDYEDTLRSVNVAKRGLMPDVRMSASYDSFATIPTSVGDSSSDQQLWFLRLWIPTDFNLARERITIGQALVTQRTALQSIEMMERTIARQVLQQIQIYQRAQAEVKFAERNLALAEARAKLAKQLFALGRGDNFAVTDAEVAFLAAESALLSAQADAAVTSYQMTRTIGTIIEVPDALKPAQEHRP